jgi:hypothetical protein
MKLKLVASAAMAAVALTAAGGANAALIDLGPITTNLTTFGGYAAPGAFLDVFTFTVPANGGSSYAVTNFSLLPSVFSAAFASLALVSNPDGVVGSGDDAIVASALAATGSPALSLSFGASAGGAYYLAVSGVSTGPAGGIYNGAISVTAVPEPETYAMMLAGLAALGFLARRRQG